MKWYIFLSVMLLSMLVVPAVFSQEFEPEDMEFQMEMHERKMEQEHRQAKMDMELRMQELDLEQRKMELERARQKDDGNEREGVLGLILAICVIVRILLAVWVYNDIRQLGSGSGIWIVIVLLAGLLGALVYAVVRIGDVRHK